MKKIVTKISAISGIVILLIIIYLIGPDKILMSVKNISLMNFIILFFLRISYWVLRTLNWRFIINAYGENLSLSHLFFARMSGHAVSQLTPTSQIGGETTRILVTKASSKKVSVASVILDKTIEYCSILTLMSIGVIIAFRYIHFPVKIKFIFITSLIIFMFLMTILFLKQKSGILSWLIDLFDKLKIRIKFLESNRVKFRETDDLVSEFYKNHKNTFLKVFLLYVLLIFLWVTEIYLTIKFLGAINVSFLDSYVITMLGSIAFIFPFLPGSLGVYEATYVGLGALVGVNAGIAITIVFIRRIIALILAGFGLIAMWKLGDTKKNSR